MMFCFRKDTPSKVLYLWVGERALDDAWETGDPSSSSLSVRSITGGSETMSATQGWCEKVASVSEEHV